MAIMQAKCAGCHSACKSVEQMTKAKWIIPGDPDNSPLYTHLNNAANGGVMTTSRMPKSPRFTITSRPLPPPASLRLDPGIAASQPPGGELKVNGRPRISDL